MAELPDSPLAALHDALAEFARRDFTGNTSRVVPERDAVALLAMGMIERRHVWCHQGPELRTVVPVWRPTPEGMELLRSMEAEL